MSEELTMEAKNLRKKEANHQWYLKNAERIKEEQRIYRVENAERLKEYKHQYYLKNTERTKARAKTNYTKCPEVVLERNKQWQLAHPERVKEIKHISYLKNISKLRERNKEWYADHPDRAKEIKVKWNHTHPENRRDVKHRRRAREHDRDYEKINSMEIYERDNWICQICQEPVDNGLKYPNPLSASLDHVIAIAVGGSHTEGNVQLAHLRCNIKAGIKAVKRVA
ncbi:MAG: HNH endonuclease [Bacteroidales bacterium]